MKKILFFLILIISFSFSNKRTKKFTPPGTSRITETFFADETEVSNFSWGEYESWVKTKFGSNSKEHLETLPDTLVWREKLAYNEPYVAYYYRHPAYKDYPVVGVSYDQATAFCKWRTERVKEYFYKKNKKEVSIEYRLPSKEEWELLSAVGSWVLSNDGKNKKGLWALNCNRPEDTTTVEMVGQEIADVTAPVYSYWKNDYGLFNILGNVCEMLAEKGISKGGSWRHPLKELRVEKDFLYNKPEAWLGFRCVCTIKNPDF